MPRDEQLKPIIDRLLRESNYSTSLTHEEAANIFLDYASEAQTNINAQIVVAKGTFLTHKGYGTVTIDVDGLFVITKRLSIYDRIKIAYKIFKSIN